MPPLNAEQLTGRVRTHVQDVADGSGCLLHPDAAVAFQALRAAAAQVDIDLVAVSGFRSFERQLTIWNEKFLGRRPLLDDAGRVLDVTAMSEQQIVSAILLWSALPGASRHHWGTEIDVIDRAALGPGQRAQLVPQEYCADGVFTRLAYWLSRHCQDYGFFLPYDRDRGGVRPEPWHLSFAPVSGTALDALTVAVLAAALAPVELAGGALVRAQLAELHARYVCAVAAPPAAALAAARLNPATRPS